MQGASHMLLEEPVRLASVLAPAKPVSAAACSPLPPVRPDIHFSRSLTALQIFRLRRPCVRTHLLWGRLQPLHLDVLIIVESRCFFGRLVRPIWCAERPGRVSRKCGDPFRK